MSQHVKAIALAPTALDRNGISVAQTLASGDLEFLQAGALASGLDRNGIATSQTPSDTTALTLDGTLGKTFSSGTRVSIFGGSNESGKTFTVLGKDKTGGIISETITGPNVTTVMGATTFYQITSITPSEATTGAIEVGVNGTTTLTTPQHVTIFGANDESTVTFTITGTDRYGNTMTEDITGPNNTTAAGEKNFKTVTKVVGNGATTGNVEIGINGLAESQWYVLNYRGGDFKVGIGTDVSSSANLTYAVQHTFSDVFASGFAEDDAVVLTHSTLTGETTNQDGNYTEPPVAMRLAITAHTSGSVNMRIVQARS
jgi:hypothetical protein|tara:strand:+ start:45 stop:989 length:945 start_codon:yes stop_codon:yes gene_type:complete